MIFTEGNQPNGLAELTLEELRTPIDERAASVDVGHDLRALRANLHLVLNAYGHVGFDHAVTTSLRLLIAIAYSSNLRRQGRFLALAVRDRVWYPAAATPSG